MFVENTFSTASIGSLTSGTFGTVKAGVSKIAEDLVGSPRVIFSGAGTVTTSLATASNAPGVSLFRVQSAAENGAPGPGALKADIDWDLTITTIRGRLPSGEEYATVTFSGSHDMFPNYEISVNGRFVYSYATPYTDAREGILVGLLQSTAMSTTSTTITCPCST